MTRRHILAMITLCLLSGSTWILDQYSAGVLQGPLHLAAHPAILALLFAAIGLRHRRRRPDRRTVVQLILIAAAWLTLPSCIIFAAAGTVASLTEILVFTLIPAIVVFLVAQRADAFGNVESPLRPLLPALAGFGGAAILIPFTLPASLAGRLWLTALVASSVLIAGSATRLHRLLAGINLVHSAAILCAASALLAAVFCLLWARQPIDWNTTPALIELLRCLFLEAPIFLLTLWLIREIRPIAASTRYLLVPFVTLAEGFAFERPRLTWTISAGALLMVAGAIKLLRDDPAPVRELAL